MLRLFTSIVITSTGEPAHHAFGQRALDGDLREAHHLRGRRHQRLKRADVIEHLGQIDLLKIARPALVGGHLTSDREHARVLAFGVVQPVDEVQRAGTDGARAHTPSSPVSSAAP